LKVSFDHPQALGYEKRKSAKEGHHAVKEHNGSVMKDMKKTKAQLVGELKELRRRVSQLEAVESKAEAALQASQALLDKTFASLEEAVFVVDIPGRRIVACNSAVEKVFGYSVQEAIGRDTEFLHINREMYEQFGRELFRALDREGLFRCEFQVRHKDGAIFLTEHTVTQISDSAGRPSHVVSVVRDITERKKAEEAVRRTEEQLRKLSLLLLEAHESERKKVARELHDSIGASLAAVKFGLERKLRAIEQGKPISGARLEDLLALVQGAMKDARRIQQNLRPLVLDELGVAVAVRSMCRDFQRIYPHIEMSLDLSIQEEDVPDPLKIVIYRISQEALNNVAKHSQADAVTLSLKKVKDHIELAIHDNGVGFDPEQETQNGRGHFGLGLASMKERAQLAGGSFTLDPHKEGGTTIHARWPCN
jgi:PAS domain S-box-containing protein